MLVLIVAELSYISYSSVILTLLSSPAFVVIRYLDDNQFLLKQDRISMQFWFTFLWWWQMLKIWRNQFLRDNKKRSLSSINILLLSQRKSTKLDLENLSCGFMGCCVEIADKMQYSVEIFWHLFMNPNFSESSNSSWQ